jgi:ubiquinone/menaquinone biosynthesis C-methylase UbiE
MSLENKIVQRYFKKLYQHVQPNPMKKVLNLNVQRLTFTPTKVQTYFESQCTRLPFENQSFDFVFSREKETKIFISPLTGLNELMRISPRGLMQHTSPLEVLLLQRDTPYLIWTEPLYNRLCVLPNHGPIPLKDKSRWLDLINFNSLYLNNYYYWNNPMEVNIQTYFGNELEYTEYVQLVTNAVEQSAEQTRLFIEKYQ